MALLTSLSALHAGRSLRRPSAPNRNVKANAASAACCSNFKKKAPPRGRPVTDGGGIPPESQQKVAFHYSEPNDLVKLIPNIRGSWV